MKVYKIRRRSDGLYSTGGMRPSFTKNGKTWNRLSFVHSHIRQLTSDYTPADIYSGCDIVEAEITEILKPIESATDYLIKRYDDKITQYENLIKNHPHDEFYIRYRDALAARKKKTLSGGVNS